jgi:hypothetical protein
MLALLGGQVVAALFSKIINICHDNISKVKMLKAAWMLDFARRVANPPQTLLSACVKMFPYGIFCG